MIARHRVEIDNLASKLSKLQESSTGMVDAAQVAAQLEAQTAQLNEATEKMRKLERELKDAHDTAAALRVSAAHAAALLPDDHLPT